MCKNIYWPFPNMMTSVWLALGDGNSLGIFWQNSMLLENVSAGALKASFITHSTVIPMSSSDQYIYSGPWAQFGVCLKTLLHSPIWKGLQVVTTSVSSLLFCFPPVIEDVLCSTAASSYTCCISSMSRSVLLMVVNSSTVGGFSLHKLWNGLSSISSLHKVKEWRFTAK